MLVKKGDDLRKDQLIMGIMKILGRLLDENGLQNRFQCYACLSTSEDEGLIEIVPNSITIGDVYNDANSIAVSAMNEEISGFFDGSLIRSRSAQSAQQNQHSQARFTAQLRNSGVSHHELGGAKSIAPTGTRAPGTAAPTQHAANSQGEEAKRISARQY